MVIILLLLFPLLTPIISGGSDNSGSGTNGINNNHNNNNNMNNNEQQLSSRVVHTKYGAVSGVIVHLDGRHLEPVEAFKGIPYASPPVGSLRFMPPVTGALWSGVKKADRLVLFMILHYSIIVFNYFSSN